VQKTQNGQHVAFCRLFGFRKKTPFFPVLFAKPLTLQKKKTTKKETKLYKFLQTAP
jgi:hypothetical protein